MSGRRPYRARLAAGAAGIVATLLLVGWGALEVAIRALPPLPDPGQLPLSVQVSDRDGALLRPFTTPEGRWRLPVHARDVDTRFVSMLIAAEDKRFYSHTGVDPLALMRAAGQWLIHGRIVSGGSTLTMQLARLMEPRQARSIAAKAREMLRALALERRLDKEQILSAYLTLAPYGANVEGLRSASLIWLGHEPNRLTLAESALLLALPQAPEGRRPDRHANAAKAGRDRLLRRLAEAGTISTDLASSALDEPVRTIRHEMPMFAAHAAEEMVRSDPAARLHRLTLLQGVQERLETLARERAQVLEERQSLAILAVDHASGEVVAHVGGPDYFNLRRAGQVDLTQAVRSPGSTLKPFIYAMAFEDGVAHPEMLIEDRPVAGGYRPENFDLTYQGTVSVRRALQLSLNVPAVALLERIDAARFAARLKAAGIDIKLPKGETAGLAIGLGGAGVRLTDLVRGYAALARGGAASDLVLRAEMRALSRPVAARFVEPVPAWQVADVLIGTPPPDNGVAGRIAFKTGTSYGYRDAWAVGFDGKYTIGVWVGRPDGAPVSGMTGRNAAAPVLFDAFARIARSPTPLPAPPKGALAMRARDLPAALRRFRPAGELAGAVADEKPRFAFPPAGASVEIFAGPDGRPEPLAMKVAGGTAPLTFLVDDQPVARGVERQRLWQPSGPGFVRLTVIDANGQSDSVSVRLQ